jgi:23S rRNA (cytosine1962-C5)-methyltransferase
MVPVGCVVLRKGRDGPLRGGNPWIFSRAIDRVEPSGLQPGSPVRICDSANEALGYGCYNPTTTIAVRVLGWGDRIAPEELIPRRIAEAIELRRRITPPDTNCYRLINGDGDGLSGLVVDRYAGVLVVQILTAGMDLMRDEVVECLRSNPGASAIFERSQGAVRREEGLVDRRGLLHGEAGGSVIAIENGIRLSIDYEKGQKTGCFLDQRENRRVFGALARGARVLDTYCYAGGFAMAALQAGAEKVIAIDTSVEALASMRTNLQLNGFDRSRVEIVRGDSARFLADIAGRFDLICLDPPPLARSRRDAQRAEHKYVELNALAMRALAPNGRLMTFSCSTHFRGPDFIRALRIAQARARRNLRELAYLGPGSDHPALLGHAEGGYLTGMLLADLA